MDDYAQAAFKKLVKMARDLRVNIKNFAWIIQAVFKW
jgi:hypothetical protein